jgi:hypothetical protein
MKKFRLIPYHHEENHFEIIEELIFEHEYAFEITDPTSVLVTSEDFGLNDVVDNSGKLVQKAEKPEPTPETWTPESEKFENVLSEEDKQKKLISLQEQITLTQILVDRYTTKLAKFANNETVQVNAEEIKNATKEEQISWYTEELKKAQDIIEKANEEISSLN